MHTKWAIACIFALGTAFPSCIQADDGLIPIQLPGGVVIRAEIADTMKKRAECWMYREHLAKDRGMLFTFDQAQAWTFWMKNTKIPLDILYFDSARKLVSQQRDVPPCSLGDRCPPYPSQAPARYVLELNAGQAAALKLADGAELTFSPGLTTP